MTTDGPQPNTARARGERSTHEGRPRGVSRLKVILIALVALAVGAFIGYGAGGGPDAPTELQLVTTLPAVTVTVPASAP